jgi:hypothetical protein
MLPAALRTLGVPGSVIIQRRPNMVEVGDRVLVESEKVGAVTRSGVVTAVEDRHYRALGLRLGIGLRPERRVPGGHWSRAASGGCRQPLKLCAHFGLVTD